MADTDDTATLKYPGGEIDLEIVHATGGADGIALGSLLSKTGHTTFDNGFVNTAACKSAITYIDGDAAELARVSEGFERMGDLVVAVDAAAQAALVYRSQGRRGSALGCAAGADALAEQCGGAMTPTLRQASEPVPFTDRERERL